jgi:hypothetical protein
MPLIFAQGLKQGDCEVKASLGNSSRPCLKKRREGERKSE